MSTNELNCLVVGSSSISDLQVKRLLLIFDRIFFLDPSENTFFIPPNAAVIKYPDMDVHLVGYLPLYDGQRIQDNEERILNSLEEARASDFFKVISPTASGFYKKFWLPLRLAYDFDTGDKDLLATLRPLVKFDPEANVASGVIRGAMIQPAGANFYPQIPPTPKCFDDDVDKRYKCEIQLLSAAARVNRALAICGVHDLVPVFLEKELQDFFFLKGRKIIQSASPEMKYAYCKAKNAPEMKYQRIFSEVSSTFISDEELANIPLRELVLARKNTFQELMKLKRRLNNDIGRLMRVDFSDEFETEVAKYIEDKIVPQAKLISNTLIPKVRDFLHLSGSFAPAALGTYIGIVNNLTPIEISLMAGASAVVGNYITNAVDYLISPRQDEISKTFSYFIKMKD